MNVRLEWLNVFADNEETLDQYFEQLGKQFYELYRIMQASQPIHFALSAQQQEQFNSFGNNTQPSPRAKEVVPHELDFTGFKKILALSKFNCFTKLTFK